jgi:hypothetical protein
VTEHVDLRPGADPDPDELAMYGRERLAACTYPR